MSRVSFHQFDTEAEAVAYRAAQGCGGWIFVCHDKGQATIFPPHMTPTAILRHPLTSSQGGRLIGQTGQTLKSYEVAE